jgi:manganese/iron transport system substrate-binding protein
MRIIIITVSMLTINSLSVGGLTQLKYWPQISLVLISLTLNSCNLVTSKQQPASATKRPLVVTTTDILCNLIQTIAKETIELKCLMPAGTDPHTYSVTPADRQAIENANLLIYAGHGFEPTLIKSIITTKNQSPKVAINEIAVTKPLAMVEDGRTEIDPHIWHDAQNGIKVVESLQTTLSTAIPAQSATYAANAKALTTELTNIDNWIKTQISTIPTKSRKLVTTHDALGYYGRAYGIPIEGALQGLSTEEKPTPRRVQKLVNEIKTAGVPTIFAESTANSKLLETVATEAKVKISVSPLYADGLGETGSSADTYAKMLISNTKVITEGLGGKFQPFVIK